MKPPHRKSFFRWIAQCVAAFAWLCCAPEGMAEAEAETGAKGTGTVQGRVYNPATKEYVHDAEVRLEGTNRVTYTESDGSFQFSNVAPGPTVVSIAYSGYTTVKESFQVAAGQTAVREVNLSSTVAAPLKTNAEGKVMLEAFSVSSEREGNSKAIMAQRRNMNISTSVSSDIFGDVADGNVGEFLKYLPGVDLDYVESEARGPRLGGMDAQYVGVAIDGMNTASADANRGGGSASRATSFEGFSITSIESIEINRTASPENDASSPAGTINMKTKRAFDRKGRHFDYNFGIAMNGEEFTLMKTRGIEDRTSYKWKPNWQLQYSEAFLNQKFGLLLSASHSGSYTEQTAVTMTYNRSPNTTDPRPSVIRQIDFGDGPKFINKDSYLLTADWKATQRLVLSLNLSYMYYEGEFWNRNFTFVGSNDNTNNNNGRRTIGGDGMLTVAAPRNTTANVAALNNGGGSSAKLVYTKQFAPRFEYKTGGWVIDGAFAFSRSVNNYDSLERGFSSSEAGGIAGGWTATRPNVNSWEWVIHQNTGPDWYNLANFTNTDTRAGGTRVTNDDRTWATEKWTGNANARWVLPFFKFLPTVVKVGTKWDEETRKNHTDTELNVWSYVGPGGNKTAVNATTGANYNTAFGTWGAVGPEFKSSHPFDLGTTNGLTVYNIANIQGMPPRVSRNAVADLFHAHPELFVNTSTPDNFYTDTYANARNFRQTVTSGYWQADTRVTAKLQLRYGARYEQTKTALTEYDPLTAQQMFESSPYASQFTRSVNATTKIVTYSPARAVTVPGLIYQYTHNPRALRRTKSPIATYPSVLLKYNILQNLEFQVGGNKGVGRQPVDNLAGVWVIDETTHTVTAPNPNLSAESHKTYQSRLVYYMGGKSPGQLSVAFSQNEATNFIRTITYSAEEFGIDDPDFAGYEFNTKENSLEMQRYRNFDFNYNQTLGFLPSEYLRGIGVGVTYSRSYANQRRVGTAPHRATGRVSYSYRKFSGSLGAVWVDDKPSESTYGRWMGASTKFDLTLNYRINRVISMYVQARNITNQKDLFYESPPNTQETKGGYLRKMEEYGDNWVFGVKGAF